MAEKIGYGKRRLISEIIKNTWNVKDPHDIKLGLNEILYILQEMEEEEGKKHLSRANSKRGFTVFNSFVKQLLYRNVANYDSMVLMTSEKGTGKSSAAIMLARCWCQLIGIRFDPSRHLAYSNKDVMEKIDLLNKFEPLVCVHGKTKIKIRYNNEVYEENISELVHMYNYEVLTYNTKKDVYEFKKPKETIMTHNNAEVFKIILSDGQNIKATKEHMFYTTRGYQKLMDLVDGDCIKLHNLGQSYKKICRIDKYQTTVKVYDIIGVPENHNFIGNNMVLHNCDEAVRFSCVKSDTIIKTIDGDIPIKKLVGKINFKVLSYNKEKKKKEWKNAKKCIKTKVDVVYNVETICGEKISATKEHLFLLKNGLWKRLDELNIGDDVCGF